MLLQSLIAIDLSTAALANQKPFWIEDESQSNSRNLFHDFEDKDDEFSTAYAGITTFAHLPFINCLRPSYGDEAKRNLTSQLLVHHSIQV